ASTLLGLGVILSAFNQRANFYSALVHLAQSNACLMVLTNLLLLLSILFGHGLQLLFYGPLRPLEIEHLYEKAWYAVTETCLAMTIFRDEFDVKFIVMFGVLLFVKCFGWIAGGRVEFMEQTPPANPMLFHIRLASSLSLLLAASAAMLWHSVTSVLERGKPNMMVMFAFEFAILLITSLGITGRYVLSLVEKVILKRDAARRKEARALERETRRRVREEARAELARRRAAGEEVEDVLEEQEEEEDEDEIDVGGWEEKGTWVFYLELITDLLKLLSYLAFFSIVLKYYGLPLHIIRDLYLTLRSFITRIRDFIRYRRATAHMNSRYPDATAEEVGREGVCVICREDMRAWTPEAERQVPGTQDQRTRPKKLPCGHVLHFACLRSWLERQQRCPTCRRPVLDEEGNLNNMPQAQRPQQRPAGVRAGGGFALGAQIGPLGFDIGVGGPGFLQGLMDRMQRPDQPQAQQPQQQPPRQQPLYPNPNLADPTTAPASPLRLTQQRIRREVDALEQTIVHLRQFLTDVGQRIQEINAADEIVLSPDGNAVPTTSSAATTTETPTSTETSTSRSAATNLGSSEALRHHERKAYAESIRDHHRRMTPQLEKLFEEAEFSLPNSSFSTAKRPKLARAVSAPTVSAAPVTSMETSWAKIPSLPETIEESELQQVDTDTRKMVERRIEVLNQVGRVVADALGELRGLDDGSRRRKVKEEIKERFDVGGEWALFGERSAFGKESQEGVLNELANEALQIEEEWKRKSGVVEGLLGGSEGKGKGREVQVEGEQAGIQ
ncbi:E3 ubiquitin-protein ligase hrd1, partial [Rhizina undulata]